jgi:hypothetical protein
VICDLKNFLLEKEEQFIIQTFVDNIQYKYDILNKALLKVSAALGELPGAIKQIM